MFYRKNNLQTQKNHATVNCDKTLNPIVKEAVTDFLNFVQNKLKLDSFPEIYLMSVRQPGMTTGAYLPSKKIVFALIDIVEYQRLQLLVGIEHVDKFITFHRPNIYNNSLMNNKRKEIAHCVHMLRGLNSQRIKQISDWITIQNKIGIRTIRFYFFKVNKEEEDAFRKMISTYVHQYTYIYIQ